MQQLKSPKYIVIILIIFVTLLVLFLWKEQLYISHKIDDQKITNFFVCLFTAVGTIATIFYTIKQHELAELVNRTTIKPDLYPQNYFFQMVDDDQTLNINGIKPNLFLTHAYGFKSGHKLLIKNIGVGIAKDIEIEWLYDISKVKELIEGIYYLTPDDKQPYIPFLNPNNETGISLPSRYLSCCGPKLFGKFKQNFFSNKETFDFNPSSYYIQRELEEWKNENFPKVRPPLVLKIKYSDVQGFEYVKNFETMVTGINNIITFSFK